MTWWKESQISHWCPGFTVGMSRKLCEVASERRRRRVEKYGERVSWLAKGQISELEGFSLTIDCCPFSENKLLLCVLKFWLENGIIWIGTWTSLRGGEIEFLWSPSFGTMSPNFVIHQSDNTTHCLQQIVYCAMMPLPYTQCTQWRTKYKLYTV